MFQVDRTGWSGHIREHGPTPRSILNAWLAQNGRSRTVQNGLRLANAVRSAAP